jgi:2'-5' RNA ligase
MIKFLDLIKEEKEKFEYGCVMLYFDFPKMKEIHNMIDSKDVYIQEGDRTFGLEDEPHCTLLYGLHDGVSNENIKSVLDKYTYTTLKAHNISLFENPDYDVLKFDVQGDNLHEINSDLQQYPYTSNFPDYHPHMTVGYLNSGSGKRYVEMLKDYEYELLPKYAVYSKPDGNKIKIKIKVKK